jgi:5-methylcytosine-specific restriction endonuclease McrA
MVKMFSDRYKCFLYSGTRCVWCGIEATHFGKERAANDKQDQQLGRWHFNLYATEIVPKSVSVRGKREILMTKDHIIPKSKGGNNHYTNLQTMCVRCNNLKGSELIGG